MTKGKFTFLFMFVATVANLILTALVIAILFAISLTILAVAHITDPGVATIILAVCFIAGMIIDMKLYAKLSIYVIEKFQLESKIDRRFLVIGKRYKDRNAAAQPKEKKRKTNMPKSALPQNNEDEWTNQAYGSGATFYPNNIESNNEDSSTGAYYPALTPEELADSNEDESN